MTDLAGIDLVDLDRFAAGFPHEVFTRLRDDRALVPRAEIALVLEEILARDLAIELDGPVEWVRFA